MEYKEVFNSIIDNLKENNKIDNFEYNTFFSNYKYKNLKNDVLTILVPSEYNKDFIKKKYQSIIEEKLEENLNRKISLFVDVDNSITTDNSIENKEKKIEKNKINKNNLNKDYTFKNYIKGPNNEYAVYISLAISKNPGKENNPLVIYGGVGLGKTHLLCACGNEIDKNFSDLKIIYVNSTTLIQKLYDNISKKMQGTYSIFNDEHKNADVLLIDDIHLFKGKDTLQDAFFDLFEILKQNNKQIIFTCDRPISELQGFQDRIKSRLGSGIMVDLKPPTADIRLIILKSKYDYIKNSLNLNKETNLSEEFLEIIANSINSNVRDLEAALKAILSYADFKKNNITKTDIENILKEQFIITLNQSITINDILKCVANYFNLTMNDIKGKKRTANIANARQIAIYIARENTELSTTELGEEFGGREHSSIIHSCNRIETKIKTDTSLKKTIEKITLMLLNK